MLTAIRCRSLATPLQWGSAIGLAILCVVLASSQNCDEQASPDSVSLLQKSFDVVTGLVSNDRESRSFIDYEDDSSRAASSVQGDADQIRRIIGAESVDLLGLSSTGGRQEVLAKTKSYSISEQKARNKAAELLGLDSTGDSNKVALNSQRGQPAGPQASKIPRQLILTGKPDKFEQMDQDIQSNVLDNIILSSGSVDSFKIDTAGNVSLSVQPRWFGDKQCRTYIGQHYDKELLDMFENAHPGYYRGDICRAAVLYQEGGFYTDVDVQVAVPLLQLVDEHTTFMSAYSVNGDIFNGLIAVVPKSAILAETLEEIRRWYRGESDPVGLMGTMTMLRGLENVVGDSCPTKDLMTMQAVSQWECGPHSIRLYEESDLLCSTGGDETPITWNGIDLPAECPLERKEARGQFLRYGFFAIGQNADSRRSLVGWPRFSRCMSVDCGKGHDD